MISVYVTNLVPAALTYVFWLIVANHAGAEIIGTVVALGSFAMILSSIAGLEVAIGMKRFLGKAVADNDLPVFKQFFASSMLIITGTTAATLLIMLHPFFDILGRVGIKEQFLPVIVVIVIGNVLINMLVNGLISALKSKLTIIPYIISSSGRFLVLFLLFTLVGASNTNVAWAYSSHYAVLSVILSGIMFYTLRKIPGKLFVDLRSNTKLILEGSLSKWLPQIIGVIESSLATLTIFSLKGALETGLYYISFAIFSIISMIPSAINMVSHPVMSGMDTERQKEFLSKSLKFGFLITMPIAAVAYYYSEPILTVFGKEFSVSTDILSILLISVPMAIIMDGCFYLLFARGNYRNLLYLGFSVNVTRMVAYFILVPIYSGMGSAIAYVIGSVIQLIMTVILVRKEKLKIDYPSYFVVGAIPFGVGYLIQMAGIGFAGFAVLVVVSLIAYSRLRLIKEDEIEIILAVLMTQEKAHATTKRITSKLKQLRLM